MGLKRGIAHLFPQNLDGQILQDADDRSKIVGEFFYNFVEVVEKLFFARDRLRPVTLEGVVAKSIFGIWGFSLRRISLRGCVCRAVFAPYSPCLTARRTGFIVLETLVHAAQIQLLIDSVIQCMFEVAGESLEGKIDGQEFQTGVDGFVAGHRCILSSTIAIKGYCTMQMTGAILLGIFSTTLLDFLHL